MSYIGHDLRTTECGRVQVNKRCNCPTVTLTSVEGDNVVSLVDNGEGPNLSIYSLVAGDNITLTEGDGVIIISSDEPELVTLDTATEGFSLLADAVGPSYSFNNLVAGNNITIVEDTVSDTLTINAIVADSPEATTLSSLGTGLSLVTDSSGPTLEIRSVTAGDGIGVATGGDGSLVISSIAPATTLSTLGAGISIVTDASGPSLEVRSFTAGDGIGIATGGDGSLVISSTITDTTLSSLGAGTSLVTDSTGPSLEIRSIAAGDGIGIATDIDGTLMISSTITDTTLSSLGTGTSIVTDPTGPSLQIRSIAAGNGIGIATDVDGNLVISSTVTDTTLSSLGTGTSLVTDSSGPSLEIRSVAAGDGIGIATDVDGTLVISSTAVSTTLSSTGGDISIVTDTTGPTLAVRGFRAGDNVTLSTDVDEALVINSMTTTLSSAGGDLSLVRDATGPTLEIRGLSAGDGIELAQLLDESIRISAIATTLNSAGDPNTTESLVIDDTGPALSIKSLAAGSGIVFTSEANHITIDTVATAAVTLSNSGSGLTLVTDDTGPSLAVKGVIAGSGISLANSTATDIVIDTTEPSGGDVTLTSAGTGNTLVSDSTGPSLQVKSLIAGTGIGFTDSGSDITINNTVSGAETVSLTSAGPGNSLVVDGTGPDLSLRSLSFGTNINLTANPNDLHIDADLTNVTLANSGIETGTQSLVSDATGPSLAVKGVRGDNTTIAATGSATDVTLSYIGATGSDVTLATADTFGTSTSLVVDGAGPDLSVKGLVAGTALTIADNGDTLTLNSTGSNVTLTNAGVSPTQSLILDGNGPQMQLFGLRAGTNVSLSGAGNNVVINSSPPDFSSSYVSVANPVDIDMDDDVTLTNWSYTAVNNGSFDATTGVYTIPTTGMYEIEGNFSWVTSQAVNFNLPSADSASYFTIMNAGLTIYYASAYLTTIDYDNVVTFATPATSGTVGCRFMRQFTAGEQLVARYESPAGYGPLTMNITETYFNARRIS